MKGISPVIATLLMLVITISLAGFAYTWLSRVMRARTMTIEVFDEFCWGNGTGFITIRNSGTATIPAGSISVMEVSANCTDKLEDSDFASELPPGSTLSGTFTCQTGAVHVWRIRGPSNVVEASVTC